MHYYSSSTSLGAILPLLVVIRLAFIPASMARKKGYSYGGFYVFGIFAFLIAVIVAACLQDRNMYIRRDEVELRHLLTLIIYLSTFRPMVQKRMENRVVLAEK